MIGVSLDSRSAGHGGNGFSLVEVMLGLLLVSVALLSVAQLLAVSASVDKAADDVTVSTTLASEKLEQLKTGSYSALTAGGSLVADVDGYYDAPDPDGVEGGDYRRRWSVADRGGSKVIEVRVVASVAHAGSAKEVTVGAIVARR